MNNYPTFPTNIQTKHEYEKLVKKLSLYIQQMEEKYGLDSNRVNIENNLLNFILENQNKIIYNELEEGQIKFCFINLLNMVREIPRNNIYYFVCGHYIYSDILDSQSQFVDLLDNYFVKMISDKRIKNDEAFLVGVDDVNCDKINEMIGFKRI